METIDIKELIAKRTWLLSAITHVLGEKYNEVFPKEGNSTLQIELKLNGVEVSLSNFIEALGAHYEERVKDHAKVILQEQVSDLVDALYKLEREVDQVTDSLHI